MKAAAVAHGGVGSDPLHAAGCRKAVDVALAALARGDDPAAAAVAGVVVLEDDPHFSAGTGSTVRLDGSVEMDASVMSSDGRFGAVAGVERVQNPVLVAAAVRESPHLLLVGQGATALARALGLPEYDPTTPERTAAMLRLREKLVRLDPSLAEFWRNGAWLRHWNYPVSAAALGLTPAEAGTDTVGVVVRARDGRFAAALSTGGTALTLRGRVGDVPLYGAGLFASPRAAVAATGTGERITEALLAHTVTGWLGAGASAAAAVRRGVDLVAPKGDVGLIVVTATELAAAASDQMAWAGRSEDETWGRAPSPGG